MKLVLIVASVFGAIANSASVVSSPFDLIQNNETGEWKYFDSHHWHAKVKENMLVSGPYIHPNSNSQQSYPIIIFFPGMGSNIPSLGYLDVIKQMSSKGSGAIVVSWDGLAVANPLHMDDVVSKAQNIVDIAKNGDLQKLIDTSFKRPFKINANSIFLDGHSSGAQIAYLLGVKNSNIDGLVLLDPVDSDPVNWTKPVVENPSPYTQPVLVLVSELGEKAGFPGFPACVPLTYGSMHFYNAFQKSAKYYLYAEHYGHADCLTNPLVWFAHFSRFCASVSDPKQYPFYKYQNFMSGSVSAFVDVYGWKNCASKKFLTEKSTFNIAGSAESANTHWSC